MRIGALVLVAALAAPSAALAAEPGISLSDRFPTAEKATTIVVPPHAEEVEIIYSPGSKIARTEVVAVEPLAAGEPTQVVWRPQRPGVVQLSAGGESIKASIRFDGIPASGIAIMIIAGLILFGGASISLRALVSDR